MLLHKGQTYPGIKKAVLIFSVLFFTFGNLAKAQITKDPSNPDLPSLPTQMPSAQLYNLLKDKNFLSVAKTMPAKKKIISQAITVNISVLVLIIQLRN